MLGNFPKDFSQVATSQMCPQPDLTFGKLPLGKLHLEIVTWKVPLGKMPLGKYLTPKKCLEDILGFVK